MKNYIVLTSFLFVAVALVHAIRAWNELPLIVGGHVVSTTISWIIALLLLILAFLGVFRIRKG